METNSSSEDPLLKVRKPYTITKQRERWTEDEHNRFLEALKLYGRTWQRIEEHVGTKTAVQIRSHAQKFFTKLEKEAVSKGANLNEIEIPIPPPRPKRKPTCPYPRKTSTTRGVSVNFQQSLTVDFSKPEKAPCTGLNAPPHQKNVGSEENASGNSEILTLFKDAPVPCASISSVNRTSPVKIETKSDKKIPKQITQTETLNPPTEKSDPNPKPVTQNPPEKVILNGSDTTETQQQQQQEPVNQIPAPFYPPFPPFLPNCHCTNNPTQDGNYTSFITAFSNLLISNLIQNPAVHHAARLAASYWSPPVETEMEMSSQNPNPNSLDASSLAALAAATVAAASSWWASQGLLPFYPPVSVFQFSPSEIVNVASQNDEKCDEGLKGEKSDCSDGNMKEEVITVNNNDNNENNENNNENNGNDNIKKKHDPSSCGSNTPSSSDVETDNITKDDQNPQKGPNCDDEKIEESLCDSNSDSNRRGKIGSLSLNESWKEVSEGGRLAFQALFKRGVLPQSFSPPQKTINGEERENGPIAELAVDLNINADVINPFSVIQGVDLYGKLKGRRTGFKPYKRCSVENRGTAGDESPAGNKRMRLEGETAASI